MSQINDTPVETAVRRVDKERGGWSEYPPQSPGKTVWTTFCIGWLVGKSGFLEDAPLRQVLKRGESMELRKKAEQRPTHAQGPPVQET